MKRANTAPVTVTQTPAPVPDLLDPEEPALLASSSEAFGSSNDSASSSLLKQ